MPASNAIYMEAIALPRFSGEHRSTVHAVMVGPFIPQLNPNIAALTISIHAECANDNMVIETANAAEDNINTMTRPCLSDDFPASNRITKEVTV